MKLTNMFASQHRLPGHCSNLYGKDFEGINSSNLSKFLDLESEFNHVRTVTSGAIDMAKVTNPLAEIHNALISRNVQKLSSILSQLPRHMNFVSKESQKHYGFLGLAVRQDCPEAIDVLIEHGADVNEEIATGVTPLISAVYRDRPECAKKLIAHGASLTSISAAHVSYEFYLNDCGSPSRYSDSMTSLAHLAAESNSPQMLSVLNGKVDLNAQTKLGLRPIQLACLFRFLEAAQWLVDHGVNTDVNFKGQSLEMLVKNSPLRMDPAKLTQLLQLVKR